MQIIEHSIVGTRSAVLRLKRPGTALEFLVFPMIHVASPEFFAAVEERLRRCDLLVVEGIRGRSALSSALTMTYRVIPANRRSGLVKQNIPYRSLGVPVINPDTTAEEIDKSWSSVPIQHRLATYAVVPVVAAMQFFGGRQSLLRPEVEVNDLPSPHEEEFADGDFAEHIDRVTLHERDARLLDTLTEIHRTRADERIDVAVVYGAGHVPAIVRGLLDRHGYRVRTAEWLTVVAG
ncbi:hypothetical protein GCM10022251_20690 [Phytohabitans flavus]|uniref:Conjugal transfer protein TraB n=1 Tax=Phytohabitans flavus TaxID=1076124 RepID=A0A6F8XZH9_9ACTN|nr:hypothetical protein [Phytohabitans flavus]BCB79256.1 hypothetical protein Pflav_056660 [Phytohabitans flavus]